MGPALVALVLAAGVALGVGALVTPLLLGFEPAAKQAQTQRGPPRAAVVQVQPPAAQTPAEIQVASAPTAPEPVVAPSAQARTASRSSARARPPAEAAPTPLTAQAEWERRRLDYEQARDAYDANERTEGRRWAQQNKVRLERHCRAAELRTPAFVEGCLAYLRATSGRAAGGGRPDPG